jgi:DNA-binding CsgD family transcriptional regulator/DNA-binding XRE family transcriptional regulator
MPGHRNFNELRKELADKVGQERLDANAAAAIKRYDAETRRLAEVRRARALTQTQLAQALGVSQAQVSRIEKQSDLYLSTLASYIEAMGGELQLVAAFEDERVHLDVGAAPTPESEPDLMGALEAALAKVRTRSESPVVRGAHDLTARQLEVITRVAEGSGVSEIARELHLTDATVKRHIRQSLDKLDIEVSSLEDVRIEQRGDEIVITLAETGGTAGPVEEIR